MSGMNLSEQIKRKAITSGFDLVGITNADPIAARHRAALADWLSAGYAGQMRYMHRNFEKRTNPALLLKNAQSVIVTGLNFNPPKPKTTDSRRLIGRVAAFGQYEDYHQFIKDGLRQLVRFITEIADTACEFKICVDSVPLAERALAERAGLGFIGKNHTLINSRLGCRILLGEIITNLRLKPDEPIKGDCLNCDKCIAVCPAQALRADGNFDANNCISYLTIEHKGRISPQLAGKIDNWIFGCDLCTEVCPYQKNAPLCQNDKFKFYADRAELNLQQILNLTEKEFAQKFADSPIKRIGLQKLKRNAKLCLKT